MPRPEKSTPTVATTEPAPICGVTFGQFETFPPKPMVCALDAGHEEGHAVRRPKVATTEPDVNVTEVGNPPPSGDALNREKAPLRVAEVTHPETGEVMWLRVDTIPESAPATVARVDIDHDLLSRVTVDTFHDPDLHTTRGRHPGTLAMRDQVPASVPATPEAMDGLRATIAEQSARIAELETWQADAREKNIIAWGHLGNIRQAIADSGCVPAAPVVTGTDIDWAAMESAEGDGGTLRLVREVLAKATVTEHVAGILTPTAACEKVRELLPRGFYNLNELPSFVRELLVYVTETRECFEFTPNSELPDCIAEHELRAAALRAAAKREGIAIEPRPLTDADLIAGYRAIASGKVKAAEWKGRRLVRLHGNPEPLAKYDHPEPPPGCMPSGFVAEIQSGTTRIMSPQLSTEAEARAWCEARCGWTVVA